MKAIAQNTLIQNRYLIVHLIGKGGMGEVYLAVDQRLGSAVALKRTFFAGDETLGNAFEREARTLARMRHPVLPKVSDHFGEGEEQYLVMEHISGDDLAKRLEISQKPFPISWVLFWADQLLDALSYLHSHEPPIIHRDIKPQNLKLTDENHIILLDFGLSKTSTGQTNVTSGSSTGSVVGYTPHYAPMEQIRGIGTNARSDIYSLSATLYQLMTNVVPADALSRADAMLNAMDDPIQPPFELNPEISKNVSDVILKGMEVSQEKRFGTAKEMQKILRTAFTQMQTEMSAETVAFNVKDGQVPTIDTPPLTSLPKTDNAPADQVVSFPDAAATPANDASIDPTVAYNPGNDDGGFKQSDVKTEVFLAGGTSPFVVPETDTPSPFSEPPAEERFSDTENFSIADGPSEFDSGAKDYSPQETTPFISFKDDSNKDDSKAAETGGTDYYTSPELTGQPDNFSTATYNENDQYSPSGEAAAVDQQPVVVPAPRKKSGGKMFVVAAGLAALFFLAIIVAGGGYYYYANYVAVEEEPEITPTPEPSFTVSPSPSPTLESISNSNSNSDIFGSNTNSDSNLTVDPTPVPTPEREEPRSTPSTDPRTTPTKPPITPRPSRIPTPRKTPIVGPTILQ